MSNPPQPRHRRLLAVRTAAALALAATLPLATPAAADWPMPRQNPQRTAVATGVSNIVEPAPFWRYFAGGTIASEGGLAWDIDNDGQLEAILCTRGQLSAKRATNNDTLWENNAVACQQLVGVNDLDGDGQVELVIRANNGVAVLRLSDGATLWSEPAGEMGTLGAVRIADLDGDGFGEVVIQECGCCAVNSDNPGFVYTFAGGGATLGQPQLRWALPWAFCGAYGSTAVMQARPGGVLDLTMGDDTQIHLLDGPSGAVVASSPVIGQQVHASICIPVNVDADPRQELLCTLSKNTPNIDARRLFLLRYVDGPTPQLQIDWQLLVGEVDGAVRMPPSGVVDLDGNGTLEVVVSGRNSDGEWLTFVFDARLGTQLGVVVGQQPRGTAPLHGTNRHAVLTTGEGSLHGHQLLNGALQPLWTLPGRAVILQADLQRGLLTHARNTVLTIDDDGDGNDELVVVPALERDRIQLIQTNVSGPVILANYTPPQQSTILTAWHFSDAFGPQLAVAQSDGNFHFLDAAHQPISGNPEVGARYAGFYGSGQWRELSNTPVLANLQDGGAPGLLVPTSRGTLVRLDATDASFAAGPQVVWSRPSNRNPVIIAGGASGPAKVASVERRANGLDSVVISDAKGETLWSKQLNGVVLADLVWGNFDNDESPDLFVQWGQADTIERELALAGDSGAQLWEVTFGPFNRQPSGAALADWNGDGIDDVLMQANFTYALNGQSGQQLAASPSYDFAYSMPTIFDVDDDGIDEVILHARFFSARALAHDLQSTVWVGAEEDRPYTYAAVLRCAGEVPRLVGGSWEFPSRLAFTQASGPAAGERDVLVLAGGEVHPSELAAEMKGASLGQLSSPVVHTNLSGDGRAVVLLGSSDGFLYGLDGCTRELLYSYDFGAAVGAVIPADADGDGLDEIVVSVADGFLYGMKQQLPISIGEVRDTDPPKGIVDEDVDEIETDETLYASWTAAGSAAGFEVAVVRDEVDGGGFITEGPWIDVGDKNEATLAGLTLENGRRYFVAVRGYTADGSTTPDTLSDGVIVRRKGIEVNVSSGGSGDYPYLVGRSCVYACAVRPLQPDDLGWLLLPLAGAAVALRRRRRRRG